MTNEEFVTDVMNHSKSGAMMQIFVIEALRFYSDIIVKNGEPKDNPLSLLSPIAWYHTAQELQTRLKENYEPKTSGNLP
jgi:hypothetical protein